MSGDYQIGAFIDPEQVHLKANAARIPALEHDAMNCEIQTLKLGDEIVAIKDGLRAGYEKKILKPYRDKLLEVQKKLADKKLDEKQKKELMDEAKLIETSIKEKSEFIEQQLDQHPEVTGRQRIINVLNVRIQEIKPMLSKRDPYAGTLLGENVAAMDQQAKHAGSRTIQGTALGVSSQAGGRDIGALQSSGALTRLMDQIPGLNTVI